MQKVLRITHYALRFTFYESFYGFGLADYNSPMILITGASGFIGRSLVQALIRDGRPFKVYNGRINDPLTIREELEDVLTVIHLAGGENRGREQAQCTGAGADRVCRYGEQGAGRVFYSAT